MNHKRATLMTLTAAATALVGASLIQPIAGDVVTSADIEAALERSPYPPQELVAAIRSCDLTRSEAILGAAELSTRTEAEIILGLSAELCERFSGSLRILRAAESGGELDDWRLYAIAKSSVELGQFPAAKVALDRLAREYPGSPLYAKALLASSELARQRGDFATVIEISRQSAGRNLDDDTSEALTVAAWRAASEIRDLEARAEAAKRLLTEHPLQASSLEVVEEFRAQDGGLDWTSFLTAPELIQRAASLLKADMEDAAIATLEDVESAERSVEWHLVLAEALTTAKRGEEALAALENLVAPSRELETAVEWQRASAALEVSVPRPGRQLNSLQRQMMRVRAHWHLNRVAELGADGPRSKKALRIIFEDTLAADRFDQALDTLRRLKELDPNDTTGARQLWKLGWKQYSDRNYSGAIGYWTELAALYPTTSFNRSGLYWAARSHELLGNRTRSQQLLQEIVDVPFSDLYGRHALKRLEQPQSEIEAEDAPSEPWPRDPILFRAEKLANFGLYEVASVEIEGLAERADARAVSALKARILANRDERRSSIIEIKKAFSPLGTPFQSMAPERARQLYYPLAYDEIIERYALRNGLDRNMVFAMIRQESAFDPQARSWAGAQGLMQVMPATGKELARRLGLRYSRDKLRDPAFSVQLGTTYYKQVRSMFGNNDELALAGYNAGPYRIKRLWREAGSQAELDQFLETLHLAETRTYVKRVLLFADSYRRLYG